MRMTSASTCAIALSALPAAGPTMALAYSGERLASVAKLTIEQARAIALRTKPGKIAKQELENEAGVSGLRYSFVIKRGKTAYEVGIDAETGAILENKIEGPNAD